MDMKRVTTCLSFTKGAIEYAVEKQKRGVESSLGGQRQADYLRE